MKIKRVNINLDWNNPFRITRNSASDGVSPGPADIHYCLQMCIPLSGRLKVEYIESGFGRYLSAGQPYCSFCWEPHGSTPGAECAVLVISILPEALNASLLENVNLLRPFIIPPYDRPYADDPQLRRKILTKCDELMDLEQRKVYAYKSRQWLIIHELILLLQEGWEPPDDYLNLLATVTRLTPAINFLRRERGKSFSLNDAAEACNLSRSRFSEIFTATFGVSFHCYRNKIRMSYAMNLLHDDIPIKEIAEECGFADVYSFSHAFKDFFNATPGSFRKQ